MSNSRLRSKKIPKPVPIFGLTEKAIIPKEKESYQPKTIIDETLEQLDPKPNVNTLFKQFNKRFFSNKLCRVQIKWRLNLKSRASKFKYIKKEKKCIISLSTPILKLRSRKDLVEILLYEMIRAFLILSDVKDKDGSEFLKHVNRINEEAGTNITVDRKFKEEIESFRQHVWTCNGPCTTQPPYFGIVKRCINRAPSRIDLWWKKHLRTCGGQFTKIENLENEEKKKLVVVTMPKIIKNDPN